MIFQPCHRHRETAEQEQQQREDREERQRSRGVGGVDASSVFTAQRPKQPRAARFEQEQQYREAGNEIFFKLHAGILRGKTAAILRFKQRSAPAAGEFIQFQLFQPLIFFQAHLEPADKSHHHAQAEEDRRHVSRE